MYIFHKSPALHTTETTHPRAGATLLIHGSIRLENPLRLHNRPHLIRHSPASQGRALVSRRVFKLKTLARKDAITHVRLLLGAARRARVRALAALLRVPFGDQLFRGVNFDGYVAL